MNIARHVNDQNQTRWRIMNSPIVVTELSIANSELYSRVFMSGFLILGSVEWTEPRIKPSHSETLEVLLNNK